MIPALAGFAMRTAASTAGSHIAHKSSNDNPRPNIARNFGVAGAAMQKYAATAGHGASDTSIGKGPVAVSSNMAGDQMSKAQIALLGQMTGTLDKIHQSLQDQIANDNEASREQREMLLETRVQEKAPITSRGMAEGQSGGLLATLLGAAGLAAILSVPTLIKAFKEAYELYEDISHGLNKAADNLGKIASNVGAWFTQQWQNLSNGLPKGETIQSPADIGRAMRNNAYESITGRSWDGTRHTVKLGNPHTGPRPVSKPSTTQPAVDTGSGFGSRKAPRPAGSESGVEAIAKADLKQHEGYRLEVYRDTEGHKTIGIGHKLKPGENFTRITAKQADDLFKKDYEEHASAAAKIPNYSRLNDEGKAALVNLTFNMGKSWWRTWKGFTRAMQNFDKDAAIRSLRNSKWYKQVGNRAEDVIARLSAGFAGGQARPAASSAGFGSPSVSSKPKAGTPAPAEPPKEESTWETLGKLLYGDNYVTREGWARSEEQRNISAPAIKSMIVRARDPKMLPASAGGAANVDGEIVNNITNVIGGNNGQKDVVSSDATGMIPSPSADMGTLAYKIYFHTVDRK